MTNTRHECALLGWHIVYLRLKRHLLQKDLATLIGVARSTMNHFESGQNITLETELKICAALGIKRWQLAKVPANIETLRGWMKKKEKELRAKDRAYRKAKGIKGPIPLEILLLIRK